jgi:site-specific recombinase XerD
MRRLTDEQMNMMHRQYLMATGRRPNTVRRRKETVVSFQRTLRGIPLRDARPDDVYAFLGTRGWSAGTRRTYHAHLSSFYGWAAREGHVKADPTARMTAPRSGRYLPRPIDSGALTWHWYGTTLLEKTQNLRVVQEAMRHEDPATTAVYTKVRATEIAQAAALLPDLTVPPDRPLAA